MKSKIHKVVPVPVAKLKIHKKNPRVIDEFKLRALKRSLEEFPDMLNTRPVLYDEDFIVMAGNMRLKAALELGWDSIPGIQINGLSKKAKEQLLIKDNISFGAWDDDILDSHFQTDALENWTGEVRVDYSFLDGFTSLDDTIDKKSKSVVRSIAFHFPNHFYKIKDLWNQLKEAGIDIGQMTGEHLIKIVEDANNKSEKTGA